MTYIVEEDQILECDTEPNRFLYAGEQARDQNVITFVSDLHGKPAFAVVPFEVAERAVHQAQVAAQHEPAVREERPRRRWSWVSRLHPEPGFEQSQYNLAMHLTEVHKNSAAILNSPAENADEHWHEHFGPCGLRNHPYEVTSYDEREVEAVLEEAEREG